MGSVDEEYSGGLPRPYTSQTFSTKLVQFESLIADLTYQDSEQTAEERRQAINENLRFDAFCDDIRNLFGTDIRSQDLKAVFRKITTNPDAKVDWSELFGYFQTEDEEPEQVVSEDISVFTVAKKSRIGEASGDKKRRDVVFSITYNPGIDCYLVVSQKGVVSVWNSKTLRLQACSEVKDSSWTTGVDYLPSLRRIIATTERSICIWDHRAKGKNQSSMFCIKPTDNSVQCMTYVPYASNLHEDCVIFGDDQGYINLLTLAANDLNTKHAKFDKKTGSMVMEPAILTNPIAKRKLHDGWVLKVKYLPDLRCFASCSSSSTNSFVLESVDRILDNLPVKTLNISKGINCFAFCIRANVIATGGNDKVIRIWHPHIFSRPTGKLIGHLFTIIDIAVNEKDQHVISLSTARVFRVWDIHTLTSLQVFTDNEERPGEKRIHCMVFDEKHERLVTGSSVLDLWPLTRTVQDTMQVPHTHDRPLTQVVYNQELNQVITVCSESVIKVWELESGKQVYHITESHGANVEVTAICVDRTGYRLMSGALDGSIKVWDFGSGQEIRAWSQPDHLSEKDEDMTITGIQYIELGEHKFIVVTGWNNRIRLLEDSVESGELILHREFSDLLAIPATPISRGSGSTSTSGNHSPFSNRDPLPDIGSNNAQITKLNRQENILLSHEMTCLSYLHPITIATGCVDGSLLIWDVQTARIKEIFDLSDQTVRNSDIPVSSDDILKAQNPRMANMVLYLVHKTRRPDPAYIKKLTGHVSVASTRNGEQNLELDKETNADKETDMDRETVADDMTYASSALDVESTIYDPLQDASELVENSVNAEAIETPAIRVEGTDGEEDQQQDSEQNLEPGAINDANDNGDVTLPKSPRSRATTGKSWLNRPGKSADVDPTARMIVSEYPPVLVSCHGDGFIRFWDLKGDLLREITAMTRRQGSPVTAVCADEDCNVLVTGDHKGYITIWSVNQFLENPYSDESTLITQLISWRAHLSRIVTLIYVNHMKAIISGSTDGSVRVWYGDSPQMGHFMGFFGQHRPWNFPSAERTSTPVLPYDISEGPLRPVKNTNEKKKPAQSYEYPLIFTNDKWKSFRRSAYHKTRTRKLEPEDKKFFGALQKPLFRNEHLHSCKTGEMNLGAVFRALPVYRVDTPERLKTPAVGIIGSDSKPLWAQDSYLDAPTQPKQSKASPPTRDMGKKPHGILVNNKKFSRTALHMPGPLESTSMPSFKQSKSRHKLNETI
ncbi:WD repeat-containing protein 64-like [Amphiura filiformis]|uniref:WD repeat-containing protein 64-like n=1 Tax=Amphiura filiformis TaxID=82378 RepID=UPI003B215C56